MLPRPQPPLVDSINSLRDPRSLQSELLEIELQRFAADARGPMFRYALYALLGAALVVAFGVWGFRFETNTQWAPVHVRPAGAPVMVVINPR